MKCITCAIEINPKWTHAIEINICPFCGQNIVDEQLKNLLSSLRETMKDLQQYPNELNDWLLSNYNYIKTDSQDLVNFVNKDLLKEMKKIEDDKDFQKKKENQKFTVKVKTENGEQEIQAERIQSEEKTNEFFKRANSMIGNSSTNPAEKTEHLRKVAQQIKKAGIQGEHNMVLSPEMLENVDQESIDEYQSMMSGGGSGGELMSSLTNTDLDEEIPDFVIQASQNFPNKNSSNSAKDIAALQRLHKKSIDARNNITSGARGSFSR